MQLTKALLSAALPSTGTFDFRQMTTITKPTTKLSAVNNTHLSGFNSKNDVNKSNVITTINTSKRPFSEVNPVSNEHELEWSDNNVNFDEDFDETIGAAEMVDSGASAATNSESGVDQSLRKNFEEYVKKQCRSLGFTRDQVNAIRLLVTLRQGRASLMTYDSVMKWHLECSGDLHYSQSVRQSPAFITRDKLFKMLRERYSYDKLYHQETIITLPHSKARALIVWNDAKAAMTSLLTDPRITDDDYLFFEDNPLSSPPNQINYVEDLNTGRAYTKTYKKLIKKPGEQVLLPVLFYIDGASTGQFADLQITAVKFTLGIFSRKAREQDHFWRILGYIPAVMKHKSQGRRMMLDSSHVDGIMAHQDFLDDEGLADNSDVNKAQDFHAMLEVVLESYVDLQDTGFYWDLAYKKKVFKDIEFVLFTPFIIADGEEADKLCGKYLSRTATVAQLCRYCECPTNKSDVPLARYPLKTTAKISRLIRNEDDLALQQMSQHRLQNSMYALRYGAHNKQGVHGACPVEMLHALLLGLFKYTRDCFFEQIGETSKSADEINALSKQFGGLLSRQSERDLPVTRFANGIKRGKLMANEHPGILLCMAAVLRSTQGHALLTKKTRHFGSDEAIRDWSQLVETLLQWERWLKSDSMEKKHVREAEQKHRYILYLLKKVAKRASGMQFKITKFHGVVHMADDILNFGVPMEFDSGSNESGHKATKIAARLTQKNEETFDRQTAIRLEEVHLLDMATLEMEEKPIANYGNHTSPSLKQPPPKENVPIGGAELTVKYDAEVEDYVVLLTSRSADGGKAMLEKGLVSFIAGLQIAVQDYMKKVPLRTHHKRKGQIFRGHNKYRGKVWRDWALIDWGDEGVLPNKIWGFVDLRALPVEQRVIYNDMRLEPSVYAIVESAKFVEDTDELEKSEIFVPISKEVVTTADNSVSGLRFYMADVEAIVQAIAVIPDIGGESNAYFMVKERETWQTDFMDFLERPLNLAEELSDEESDDL